MKVKHGLGLVLAAAVLLAGCARRPADPVSPGSVPPPTAGPNGGAEETASNEETLVSAYMERMTLREKVGQLFFIRPDSLDPGQPQAEINGPSDRPVTAVTEEIRQTLAAYPVGGVAVFGKNIVSPQQLSAFTAELQAASRTPLFIGTDEEGGAVARLANAPGFRLARYRSAAAVGAAGDPAAAEEMGRAIGRYLRQYGFNVDFAPVADVNTNPDNPVIGERAFSSDPETAAAMAGAMARGLGQEGILPVYKHFPGHGDTAEDSHQGLAVTGKTLSELEACEWLPYTQNDLTGCAVMVGHIAAPNLTGDMTPASLSETVVEGCLRGRLGFDGLVITDSLAMDAVAREHSPGEAAVRAIQAGCDVILMPNGLAEAFDAVLDAVERGEISEERLDESVRRVLEYKQALGLLQ